MERSRRHGARLVLASGLLLGVGYAAVELLTRPGRLGVDYRVYHVAAEAFLSGEPFYGVTPSGLPGLFQYVYPPVTVLFFAPLALLGGWPAGFVVHTLLTVAAGLATAGLLVDYTEEAGVDLVPLDRALIAGYTVASVHAMPSLVFGQVNHHLALLFALGFLALARDRETLAGGAFGLAAFVKLFPAAVGLWLLVRRRVRAIAAAVAVGSGLSLLGLLAFGPETIRRYVETAVLPRTSPDAFAGGLGPTRTYLTLRRPISVALPSVDPSLYGPLAALAVAPALWVLYRGIDDRIDWLVGTFGTVTAILLVFPSFPIYVVLLSFPLVPLLYLFPVGRARTLFVAGALLTNLSIRYDEVLRALSTLDLDPAVAEVVRSVLRPPFTVATPPLLGLCLALVACVCYRR